MFELLKARKRHGTQYVKNITGSILHERFRGLPLLDSNVQTEDMPELSRICPLSAIGKDETVIDIGRCNFCGSCSERYPDKIIFTNFHKTGTDKRSKLIIGKGQSIDDFFCDSIIVRKEIKKMFGRSLKLRSVSAGGCNACELELNACGNVNFDMGRYGIEVAASPRHSDGLVITGPVTRNMAFALEETFESIPEPRIIIAMGACAISGGVFSESKEIDRRFFDKYVPDLYIPGCPPHPLTFINAVIRFLGVKYE